MFLKVVILEKKCLVSLKTLFTILQILDTSESLQTMATKQQYKFTFTRLVINVNTTEKRPVGWAHTIVW